MLVTQLKDYINKENKIPFILQSLGCGNIKDNTDYISASFPDGDNKQGINISKNEYLSFCSWSRSVPYSEGKDLINLIEMIKDCDFISAFKWLHEILELKYSIQDLKSQPKNSDIKSKVLSVFTKHLTCNAPINVADINVMNESILDEYIPIPHINLLHEGITPSTCKKFDIEYSYKRSRIMIPIRYWLTGELIAFNARTTVDGYEALGVNKYSFTKGYNKSCNLYGLWENYDEIQRKGYVVVFESEKSVLKRDSQFDNTAVALGGKTISEEQKRILIGLNVNIILALDNDVSWEENCFLAHKFYGIRNVYIIKDNDNLLGKKDSPADACEKDYRELFSNKIKYMGECNE